MIHPACVPALNMSFGPIWFQLKRSIIADDGFLKIAFIKKDLSPFEAGGGLLSVIGLGKDGQATQQEHS
jgi:hypothetical protein